MLGILVSLELGAFSVAVQTVLSGKSQLPLKEFSIAMLGIHMTIAVVEGFVTLTVVNLMHRIRPEIVQDSLGIGRAFKQSKPSVRPLVGILFTASLVIGGLIAWFASAHPDGLEWSIRKIVGSEELPGASEGLSGRLSRIQEKTAPLAGYDIGAVQPEAGEPDAEAAAQTEEEASWPEVSAGRSLSGVVGSLTVLALVCFTAFILSRVRGRGLRTGGERSR
jgi:cobalt/nickel transport system permease protein